jgi:hypothetical protein
MTAPLGSFRVPEILPVVAAGNKPGQIAKDNDSPIIAAMRSLLIGCM